LILAVGLRIVHLGQTVVRTVASFAPCRHLFLFLILDVAVTAAAVAPDVVSRHQHPRQHRHFRQVHTP